MHDAAVYAGWASLTTEDAMTRPDGETERLLYDDGRWQRHLWMEQRIKEPQRAWQVWLRSVRTAWQERQKPTIRMVYAIHGNLAQCGTALRLSRNWVRYCNLERRHIALDWRNSAEAYRGEMPVDMIDMPLRFFPTSLQS